MANNPYVDIASSFVGTPEPSGDTDSYKDYAKQTAAKYGIPEPLFMGYFEHESGWNPQAKNPKSTATGIGQILENNPWAKQAGLTDRTDPYGSINAIGYEMAEKYKKLGNWEKAVGATGENTPEYLNKVLGAAGKYGYTPTKTEENPYIAMLSGYGGAPTTAIGMRSPVEGGVMGGGFYDKRPHGPHHGGDIYGNAGTPVTAPVDLEVLSPFPGRGMDKNNMRVGDWGVDLIDRNTGRVYSMIHMNDTSGLKQGQKFKAGEQVGTIGSVVDNPHLHMAVHDSNNNPINWMAEYNLQRGSRLAGSIAAGGNPYINIASQFSAPAAAPAPEGIRGQIVTGAKEGLIKIGAAGARISSPEVSSMMRAAMGYPDLEMGKGIPNAPEERVEQVRGLLTNELFPGGVPATANYPWYNIAHWHEWLPRTIASMWPELAMLTALSPLAGVVENLAGGAVTNALVTRGMTSPTAVSLLSTMAGKGAGSALSFGMMGGILSGDPVGSAAFGAILGTGGAAAGLIPNTFMRFLAKTGGGFGLGYGSAILEGADPEEAKRQGVLFALFEAFGVRDKRHKEELSGLLTENFKDTLREVAEKNQEVINGYGVEAKRSKAIAYAENMIRSYASGSPEPQLERMLPRKVLDDIREGREIESPYLEKVVRRAADLASTDYPPTLVKRTVEVPIGKKGTRTKEVAGFVEIFPQERRTDIAKFGNTEREWYRLRQAMDNSLEISKHEWDGAKGLVQPWSETQGEYEIRLQREKAEAAAANAEGIKTKLDELRARYDADRRPGWEQLTPAEVQNEIQEMIRRYRSGSDEPLIEAVLPTAVVEDIKRGHPLPPTFEQRLFDALAGGSYPGFDEFVKSREVEAAQTKQWENYLENQQRVVDDLANQANLAAEQDVAPSLRPILPETGEPSLRPPEGRYEKVEYPRDTMHRGATGNAYLPDNDPKSSGRLRNLKSSIARISKRDVWEAIKGTNDEGVVRPPEADAIEERAGKFGAEVFWVRDAEVAGMAGVARGKPYIMLNDFIGDTTYARLLEHEIAHNLQDAGHPAMATLVAQVDYKSPKFQEYKKWYESPLASGIELSLPDYDLAREIVGDFFADTGEIGNLREAFRNPEFAEVLLDIVRRLTADGWTPKIPRSETLNMTRAPMIRSALDKAWDILERAPGVGRKAAETRNAYNEMYTGAKKLFATETLGPIAMKTAQDWVKHITRAKDQVLKYAQQVKDYRIQFARMGYDKSWGLSGAMERGDKIPREWEPYAKARNEAFDKTHSIISAMKDGVFGYISNYAPHLFKDAERARELMPEIHKRYLEGRRGFLKHRGIMLDMDTIRKEYGLEPLHENPMIQDIEGLMHQWRYIEMNRFLDQQIKDRLFIPVEKGKPVRRVPEGFRKTDPRVMRQGYAPQEMLNIIYNHMTPEMSGPMYMRYRTLMNFWNALHVSLSGFHAMTTVGNQLSMGIAKGIPEFIGAVMSGDPAKMATSLKRIGPMSVVDSYRWYFNAMKERVSPGARGPRVANVVKWATEGGLLPESTLSFTGRYGDTFADIILQLKKGEVGKATNTAIHWAGKPIMGYLVPSLKYGSTLMRIAREYDTLKERYDKQFGKDWSPEAEASFAKDMGNIAYNERQFSENIFGELDPDNLHWNRNLSKGLKALIAYPGWNVGTTRWLAGMARFIAQTPERILTGKPYDYQARLSFQFGLGLMVTVAIANTLLHTALNNGKGPDDWQDVLVGAKTGKFLANGQPERVTIASYMKDLIGAYHDPVAMASHKLQAPFTIFKELYENADYFGTEIRSPKAGALEQTGQLAKYMGEKAIPFAFSGFQTGRSGITQLGGMFGFRRVPRYMSNTDAMNRIDEILTRESPKARTKEQADRSRLASELKEMGWEGQIQEMREKIAEAKSAGQLTPTQAKNIKQAAMGDRRVIQFKKLRQLEDMLEVYEKGTPDERALWNRELRRKWARAGSHKRRDLREDYARLLELPMSEEMPELISGKGSSHFSILGQ